MINLKTEIINGKELVLSRDAYEFARIFYVLIDGEELFTSSNIVEVNNVFNNLKERMKMKEIPKRIIDDCPACRRTVGYTFSGEIEDHGEFESYYYICDTCGANVEFDGAYARRWAVKPSV